MQIISDTTEFHIDSPTAVALGKFDGIHLGHRKLLECLLKVKERGLKTAVFTFDPSAAVYFGTAKKEITLRDDKRRIFEELGIDILVEYPLNADTAAILPRDFIEKVLLRKLSMSYIACGSDVSFGYRGEGNAELLVRAGREYGFEVEVIEKLFLDGKEVSSSLLRQALSDGDTRLAERILGEPYRITGKVETGRRLGRKLGFPTMNIYPDPARLLPGFGVYGTQTHFDGTTYPGLTYVGIRPTVTNERRPGIETFLFDFDTDMYGKTITVAFLEFVRPEMTFGSLEELRRQMLADLRYLREKQVD
ncbi:MAG: bifunctional riboflavin kinase/FAD synthetase [Lachnospiraceae bacterium]|nr:bifunctional riboflavin kinase/FAD synthetase [Lachnospiraceae bacterium]